MKRDLEHLKLLSVFYYILSGLTALMSSFALIYVVLGIVIVTGSMPAPPPGSSGPPMPVEMGWFFLVFGGGVVFVGWTMSICMILAGINLARHRGWTFCCFVAGFVCLNVPMGTLLGVFTFLVLLRQSVKDLFEGRVDEPYDPEDDENYGPRHRRNRRLYKEDNGLDSRDEPVQGSKASADPHPDDDRFTEKYSQP